MNTKPHLLPPESDSVRTSINHDEMRYFYAAFSHGAGFGSITLQLETFPIHDKLIDTIITESGHESIHNVTILNIFEFKNQDDYDQFTGKKE